MSVLSILTLGLFGRKKYMTPAEWIELEDLPDEDENDGDIFFEDRPPFSSLDFDHQLSTLTQMLETQLELSKLQKQYEAIESPSLVLTEAYLEAQQQHTKNLIWVSDC